MHPNDGGIPEPGTRASASRRLAKHEKAGDVGVDESLLGKVGRVTVSIPALVEAAARGLTDANLTILNGTQGVNEVVTGLVGQGMSILETLKKSNAVTGNGASPSRLPQATKPSQRPTAEADQ